MKANRFRLLAACVALVATAAACTSSKPKGATSTEPGTPLTLAQAEVLAGILAKNYEAGGAVFTVTVPYSDQTTYSMNGSIDYTKGTAQSTLRISSNGGKDTADSQLLWTKTEVLEQLPGLTEAVAAKGRPGVTYVSRPMTTTSPQDVVLNLVLGTASAQRENPALIQQGTDQGTAAFLRTDTLRGVPVDVFRFGKRTTFWVAKESGDMMRLEATLAIAPGVTVMDILEHKPVAIPGPKVSEVVLATEIPDIMKDLTGNTIPAATPPPAVVTTKP